MVSYGYFCKESVSSKVAYQDRSALRLAMYKGNDAHFVCVIYADIL